MGGKSQKQPLDSISSFFHRPCHPTHPTLSLSGMVKASHEHASLEWVSLLALTGAKRSLFTHLALSESCLVDSLSLKPVASLGPQGPFSLVAPFLSPLTASSIFVKHPLESHSLTRPWCYLPGCPAIHSTCCDPLIQSLMLW